MQAEHTRLALALVAGASLAGVYGSPAAADGSRPSNEAPRRAQAGAIADGSGSAAAAMPPLVYAGLAHAPLGNAELAINNGVLTVSNIGSSGLDGFSVSTGHADYLCIDWAPSGLGAPLCGPGLPWEVALEGRRPNGTPSSRLLLGCGESGHDISVRTEFPGAGPAAGQVLDDGQVVAEFVVNPDEPIIIVMPPDWPPGPWPPDGPIDFNDPHFTDAEIANQQLGVNWDLGADYEVNTEYWAGPEGNTVVGDTIIFTPVDPTPAPPLGSVNVTGANIPPFKIAGEALGKFGNPHMAEGNAQMVATLDALDVFGTQQGGSVRTLLDYYEMLEEFFIVGIIIYPDLYPSSPLGASLEFSQEALWSDTPAQDLAGLTVTKLADGIQLHSLPPCEGASGAELLFFNNDQLLDQMPAPPEFSFELAIPFEGQWIYKFEMDDGYIYKRICYIPGWLTPNGIANEVVICYEAPCIPEHSFFPLATTMTAGGGLSEFTILDEQPLLDGPDDPDPPSEPCDGDFNGDGEVNGSDLGQLLSDWGECNGCPSDLNGDGFVDGGDLGFLLSSWGGCGDTMLMQNHSNLIEPGVGVACAPDLLSAENAYARSYDLTQLMPDQSLLVWEVAFGIETNTGGQSSAQVTLYVDTDGGDPRGPGIDLQPLGPSKQLPIAAGGPHMLSASFDDPVLVPANARLVVEVALPAQADGATWPGCNAQGEDAPTFIRAAECGESEFVTMESLGFPDVSWVQHVFVEIDNGI